MSYLVDTNMLSEPTKPAPDDRVLEWLGLHGDEAFVSALTLGEIKKGILLLPAGKRRKKLERGYEDLCESFDGRILELTMGTMAVWAEMYAQEQLRGHKLPGFDSLLAATALEHRLVMVTRNTKDFPKELPVLDLWKP